MMEEYMRMYVCSVLPCVNVRRAGGSIQSSPRKKTHKKRLGRRMNETNDTQTTNIYKTRKKAFFWSALHEELAP